MSHSWLQLSKSGSATSIDELISYLNQMSERFGGYTTKTYNLLALALLSKSDVDRALKIFETALAALQLDAPEGQHRLTKDDKDVTSLIYNYIKCLCLKRG